MKNKTPFDAVILAIATLFTANVVTAKSLDTPFASGDLCLGAMLNRYLWAKGSSSDQNKTLQERYKLAQTIYENENKKGFNTLFNGPWDRSLVPVFEAQRDSIFDSLLAVDSTGSLVSGSTFDSSGSIISLDAVEKYLKDGKATKLSGLVQSAGKAFGAKPKKVDELLHPTSKEVTYSAWAKNTATISAACAQISVSQAFDCTKATSELLVETNYNTNMILPKIWVEFITDARLREGVRQSAIIMLDRIKTKNPGNLFADLEVGFQRAGLAKVDANEAAWKTLALYGNGGPNTGYRLTVFDLPAETSNLVVGLSLISTAIAYIDFSQRFAGQSHYALPSAATDSCLTPKPYHFWLNAYLSRWLVKLGYSSEVAQMATVIVAKGYQVNRDVNNAGGGLDKILSKPTDHPTNQVIRLDLTLSASGAVYGSLVDSQTIKPFSLNKGLTRLNEVRGNPKSLSKGLIQNLMSSDKMRLVYLWDQLFQPNEVLMFYRTQQK